MGIFFSEEVHIINTLILKIPTFRDDQLFRFIIILPTYVVQQYESIISMKKNILLLAFALASLLSFAQNTDSTSNYYINTADNLLLKDNKLVVGGYGEIHYNQPLNSDLRMNGALDVHRMVMLFGYNFNEKYSLLQNWSLNM